MDPYIATFRLLLRYSRSRNFHKNKLLWKFGMFLISYDRRKGSAKIYRRKINKMVCAPSDDSDQQGHPPSLIRVFIVCMKKAWFLSYPLNAQRRLWSDRADAKADQSSLGTQSFCWFCHEVAQINQESTFIRPQSLIKLQGKQNGMVPSGRRKTDIKRLGYENIPLDRRLGTISILKKQAATYQLHLQKQLAGLWNSFQDKIKFVTQSNKDFWQTVSITHYYQYFWRPDREADRIFW